MSDEEVDPRFALSEEASGLLGVVSPVVRADEGSEDDQDHGDVEELNREVSVPPRWRVEGCRSLLGR